MRMAKPLFANMSVLILHYHEVSDCLIAQNKFRISTVTVQCFRNIMVHIIMYPLVIRELIRRDTSNKFILTGSWKADLTG